jgi:hypothetical protein
VYVDVRAIPLLCRAMVSWTTQEREEMLDLIRADNTGKVSEFVDQQGGPDVCIGLEGPFFENAVLVAVKARSVNVLGFLMGVGVDPNARIISEEGIACSVFQAVIMMDCRGPQAQEIMRILLRAGADLFGAWPYPANEAEFNVIRNIFCDVFVEGTCTIQAIMRCCDDDICADVLDSIPDPLDAEVQRVIRAHIRYRTRFPVPGVPEDALLYTTALGTAGSRGREHTCRRLIANFCLDVNTLCIGRDPVDAEITGCRPNPSDLTILGHASSRHSTFAGGCFYRVLILVLNAGGNPLIRMYNGLSSFAMAVKCVRHLARNDEVFLQNGFQPSPENISRLNNARDAVALMQAHARFRFALRVLRAGQGSHGASIFSVLSQDLMLQVASRLAPVGTLLTLSQITTLYQSRRPWFTSGV